MIVLTVFESLFVEEASVLAKQLIVGIFPTYILLKAENLVAVC